MWVKKQLKNKRENEKIRNDEKTTRRRDSGIERSHLVAQENRPLSVTVPAPHCSACYILMVIEITVISKRIF